jgi:hypothetical protein
MAAESAPPLPGVSGASAQREYEHRKGKDDHRLKEKWGPLGDIAVALSPERQSTKAWVQGAIGEQRLGARLDSLISADLAVVTIGESHGLGRTSITSW